MASISILKNINKDVLRGHLEHCVYDSLKQNDEEAIKEKIDEIEKIIDKLNKL